MRPLSLELLFAASAVLLGSVGCSEAPQRAPVGRVLQPVHTVCGLSATTTLGIDVSVYHGSIDFGAVALDPQGFRFAIARLGQGTTADSQFASN